MLNAWEFTASHPLPKNPHFLLPAGISNAAQTAHVLKHLRVILGNFLGLQLLECCGILGSQRTGLALADAFLNPSTDCTLNGLNTLDSVLASFG